MNCEGWRIQIVALVDGSCEPRELPKVERHLNDCATCQSFYREQLEFSTLLGSPEMEATPPEHLWFRIESRLQRQEAPTTWSSRLSGWLDVWRFPALRYAAISSSVLLLASLLFLSIGNSGGDNQRLLAQLDAYQLRVEGNPFLARLGGAPTPNNPFFSIEPTRLNPFQAKGNQQ
jgi:anti-sigma factor RsiW